MFATAVDRFALFRPVILLLLPLLLLLSPQGYAVNRVTNGVVVAYDFAETSGATVNDVSGVAPLLPLTIDNPSNVQWQNCGGLTVLNTSRISSSGAASKLYDRITASEAITLEAWITPSSTDQTGPARIMTLSESGSSRNFTLGQNGSVYNVRLRTTNTTDNGTNPSIESHPSQAMSLIEPTHVVYTRNSAGDVSVYINGSLNSSRTVINNSLYDTQTVDGTLANWDSSMGFALANEFGADRHWFGQYHYVAVFDRVLSNVEVTQNYNAGTQEACDQPPSAQFSSNQATVEVGEVSGFDASASVDSDGTIVSYAWDFGDGTTATGVSTNHQFSTAGIYTVKLSVTDNAGNIDTTSRHTQVVAPDTYNRITTQPDVLYTFTAGTGQTVRNISNATGNLDLIIPDTSKVSWNQCGGLAITDSTHIGASVAPVALVENVIANNALTLEAWIVSSDDNQTDSPRIFTLSNGTSQRNFTFGQDGAEYYAQMRTTYTGLNAEEAIATTQAQSAKQQLTHVAYTRGTDGQAYLYINGELQASESVHSGTTNWTTGHLIGIASEVGGEHPWLGEYYLLAAYSAALSPADIQQNYQAGIITTCNLAPVARFTSDPQSGVAPLLVNVNASTSEDYDGTIIGYSWDFGDGHSTTGVTAAHTYTTQGSYTLTLTVTDNDGETHATSQTIMAAADGRVTQDQVQLYDFTAGSGSIVLDQSGVGTAIDLTINDPANVAWVACGGLDIEQGTFVGATGSTAKLNDAVSASNEITLEAWLTPANTTQSGPARMVTYSSNGSSRNVTLGQNGSNIDVRLRTSDTSTNGTSPNLQASDNGVDTALTHWVYTRNSAGQAKLYKNGSLTTSTNVSGTINNWDSSYTFGLANEATNDRPWLGEYRLVATYSRALTDAEIDQNYMVGVPDACGPANTAPELSAIADVVEFENNTTTVTLSATDAENDQLTFTATGLPSFAVLTTNVISIVPGYADAGTYGPVTVSVTDGTETVQTTFSITIANTNRAPTISAISDQTLAENTSVAVLLSATDADNDSLSFSTSTLPSFITLSGNSVIIAPDYTNAGIHGPFTVSVSDGVATDQTIFSVVVTNNNQAPVFSSIADVSIAENSSITITLNATDADSDALTFSATGLPGFVTLSANTIIVAPGFSDAGNYGPLTVSVTDGTDTKTSTFSIVIQDTNRVPVISSSPITSVAEGQQYTYNVVATDEDLDALQYSFSVSPAGMDISLLAGAITWAPGYQSAGAELIVVNVTDGLQTIQQSFTLTIANTNQIPVMNTLADQMVGEGSSLVVSLSATDADNDALTYSATGLPVFASLVESSLTFSPSVGEAGVYGPITVTANDGVDSHSESFSVSVESNNQGPEIVSIPVGFVIEGDIWSYALEATDLEGDSVTFTADALPENAVFDSAANTVTWPTNGLALGGYEFQVSVSDGQGGTDSQSVAVEILSKERVLTHEGTEFWIPVSLNSVSTVHTSTEGTFDINLVSDAVNTDVTIEIPALGVVENITLTANVMSTYSIDLTEFSETEGFALNTLLENYAIHITAGSPISAYFMSQKTSTSDGFLGLPVASLGKDYIAATYIMLGKIGVLKTADAGQLGPIVTIVATEDNTSVTIDPIMDIFPGGQEHIEVGTPIEIVMNAGDVYNLETKGSFKADLTGSMVHADKPVAVLGQMECVYIPVDMTACDHIVEQLPPIESLATEFYSVPFWGRTVNGRFSSREYGDTFRVVAPYDDTKIYINEVLRARLSQGEYYEFLGNKPLHVSASHPILMAQYSNGNQYDDGYRELESDYTDPFMVVVPPAEQFLNHYTINTPARDVLYNFVNLLVPTSVITTITVDGISIDENLFSEIPGSIYSYYQLPVEPGSHRIEADEPFGAYVYGYDYFESYGYLGGMALGTSESVTSLALSGEPTQSLDDQWCAESTVVDSYGRPIGGVRIKFNVAGVSDRTAYRFTTAYGVASYCYRGDEAGVDTVIAYVNGLTHSVDVNWTTGTHNLAPVITSVPAVTAEEGGSYIYDIVAKDPEGGALTYALIEAPTQMTVDQSGVISWPNVDLGRILFGRAKVVLSVSDSLGLETLQSFELSIYSEFNTAPTFVGGPSINLFGTVGVPYIFDLNDTGHSLDYLKYWIEVNDVDEDAAYVDILSGPENASILRLTAFNSYKPGTGQENQVRSCVGCNHYLDWTPQQPGEEPFELGLRDSRGASGISTLFTVNVAPNLPPQIVGFNPGNKAAVGYQYSYVLNVENDVPPYLHDNLDDLRIVFEQSPANMRSELVHAENTQKLRIYWQPNVNDVGFHTVRLRVDDRVNSSAVEEFTIEVINDSPPPVITGQSTLPKGEVSIPYQYQIEVNNPTASTLTYGLAIAPEGLVIDEVTGVLSWTPPTQEGYYPVRYTATNEAGLTAEQTSWLRILEFNNRAPEFIPSYLPKFAKVGVEFTHQAIATDREGDTPITYGLTSKYPGPVIDQEGKITWTPTATGSYWLNAKATDSLGHYSSRNAVFWYVTVQDGDEALDAEILLTPTNIIDLGDSVTLSVVTENEASAPQVELTVDGEIVTVDALLQAQITPTRVGKIPVVATVTDGYQTVVRTTYIFVRDPADITPPFVKIDSPAGLADITSPTAIFGTAQDDNLVEVLLMYKRADKPLGTSEVIDDFVELYRGPQEFMNEAIATLDTTMLVNGTYQILLQATDSSDLTAGTFATVVVSGDLKVGNFSFTVQDANIPLAGIPISVSRTYDSRRRNESMDFGYGWSVDYQNLRLEENLEPTNGYSFLKSSSKLNFQTGDGGVPISGFCLRSTLKKVVTVTLPNGDVEKFIPKVRQVQGSIVAVEDPDCYLVPNGDGLELSFIPDGDTQSTLEAIDVGTLSLSNFDDGDLVYSGDGFPAPIQHYKLTTQAGYEYVIDQDVGIKTITDPNGHTLTYTDSGISHSSGKSLVFDRDGEGRITDIKYSNDELVMHYEYDSAGDLEYNEDLLSAKTQYTYDGNHGLVDMIDPLGRKIVKNIYDDNGRLVGQENGDGTSKTFGHNITDRTSVVTDLDGRTTHYNYDDFGNVLDEVKIITDGSYSSDLITSYTYDGNHNQETKMVGSAPYTWVNDFDEKNNQLYAEDPEQNRVSYFDYNDRGQEGRIVDELGRETTMGYTSTGSLENIFMPALTDPDTNENSILVASNVFNTAGFVINTTDLRGFVTTYVPYPAWHESAFQKWYESNDISGETEYVYDSNNNLQTESRERTVNGVVVKEVITYQYDVRNRLTKTIYPDTTYTETVYDLAGNMDKERDRFGVWTDYDYDVYGRLMLTTYVDETTEIRAYSNEGLLKDVTDRMGRTTHYDYDDAGRQWKTTFHNGAFTETKYTPQGWVQYEWDEKRNLTEYEYYLNGRRKTVIRHTDSGPQSHSFEYYANGELFKETDALGRVTTYDINEFDQRIATEFDNATTIGQRYDAMGARTKQIDQNGRSTRYSYDDLGRLEAVTPEVTINDVAVPDTSYTYDEVGNKLTQTDAEGRTTHWTYDYYGRVLTRQLPEGMTETFVYDDAARTVAHTDFNGDTNTTYMDNQGRVDRIEYHDGRLEEFTYWANGQVHTVTVNSTDVTTTVFDDRDRLDHEIKPDGTRLDYQYDDVGNRTQVKVTRGTIITVTDYTFDELNRLDTVTDASGETKYTYYDNGSLWTVTFPNGVVSEYQYNTVNQLEVLTTKNSAGTVLSSYTYGLDDTGRREDITEADGRFTDYTYDNLYRLTDEVVTEGGLEVYNANYIYDWVGNRKSQTVNGELTSYLYDLNDRLTSQGATSYTHDNNGNTLTETVGGVDTTYSYDAKNKVVSVDKGGVVTGYTYDSSGIRSSKTEAGVTTSFVVDLNRDYAQVLEEVVGDIETAPASKSYSYGLDLLSQDDGSDFRFFMYDGLGSTRALSDIDGVVTDTYDYEAFGELDEDTKTGTTDNSYLYAGEQLDEETGNYYLRARYMDPGIGSFLTMDMWMGLDENPITLNKYLYANADPVLHTDPTGKFSTMQVMAATSIVGTLASLSTSQYSPFGAGSGGVGQTTGSIDLGDRPDIGTVIEACVKEHYDFDDVMLRQIVASGTFPIYKPFAKLRVIGTASRFTNFISAFGHFTFRGARLPFRLLGTKRAFGVAGRANIGAAAGLAAYDVTSVSLCINHHL